MLVELRIRDLAIMEEVHIGFSHGLNVLTGETGAGKSIIIHAVNMLLGDRASETFIRTGAAEGTVEALFDVSEDSQIRRKLNPLGVDEMGEVLIRRTINRSSRSRAFLNGQLATIAAISRIGEVLLSVYGQHEHQSLQSPDTHLDILDEFGKANASRKHYEEAFREMDRIGREITGLREREGQIMRDRELMAFQSQEITAANLQGGEEEALREQKAVLSNAERLFEWAHLAERVLYSEESSVTEKLDLALKKVREMSGVDPSIASLAETIESSIYQTEEVAYALRDYREKVEFDPERLEAVEGRMEEIRRLKMKYGRTVEDILRFRDQLDQDLQRLDSSKARINSLGVRLADVEQESIDLARKLSGKRKEAAAAFQKIMVGELASLGMRNTVFEVRFDDSSLKNGGIRVHGVPLGPKGMDSVEFYISPNVGEEPRPLSRIASGGELSRIMLAIKGIAASTEPGQTLIFDEVDAGIGGGVAEVVGKKLKELSQYHQVLCVTHLPQIACFADAHHRVTKTTSKQRTLTETKELGRADRVEEIARMLGGREITEKTRAHALEMIDRVGE